MGLSSSRDGRTGGPNVTESTTVWRTVHGIARAAFLVVVASVVAILLVRWTLNTTANDLRLAAHLPSAQGAQVLPPAIDTRVAAWFAASSGGSAPADATARANLLDQRADRLGEMAGTVALAGVLLALATPDHRAATRGQRSGQVPATSTSSSGSD